MQKLCKKAILLALSIIVFSPAEVDACTRLTYNGMENIVVTGRSMDWVEDIKTDLWAIPAGITKRGSKEANSVQWTSKYGSVIACGYNIATTDGLNTEGLNANLLYLATADYGKPKESRQNMSILSWAQYFLDNYATVREAVEDFSQDKFNMTAQLLPNGDYPAVHLAITDPTGDNAIFEYIDGKLVVYQSKKYTVMTNEPNFDKQLVLNAYWQNLKGAFLPGTAEPDDRFVRTSFYVDNASETAVEKHAIAIGFSLIRNASVPFTKQVSGKPNVAATIWRSVSDLQHRVYYFESTDRPNVFWVNIDKLNLQKGAPVTKLPLSNGEIYAGDTSPNFIPSKPFFQEATLALR